MGLENIWVKRGTGISPFGAPLVVMAAARSGQQHWHGEYFILLNGKYPALLTQYTTVKIEDVPADLITVDAEFMRTELDQQATSRLSVHCFDLYEKTNREGFLRPLELADGDHRDILRAWLRADHQDGISRCETSRRSLRSARFWGTWLSFLPSFINRAAQREHRWERPSERKKSTRAGWHRWTQPTARLPIWPSSPQADRGGQGADGRMLFARVLPDALPE